jgi:hypothetical protein
VQFKSRHVISIVPASIDWETRRLTARLFFFPIAQQPLGGLGRRIFRGFTITHFRHNTVGRTPLDEGPARRRDLYLTTHNTHNRQTSMPPSRIRTHDPSKRVAADPRLRPRGHWDRRYFVCLSENKTKLGGWLIERLLIHNFLLKFIY